MEDPGGAEGFEHGGWAFKFERGEEGDKFKLDETMESDALLLGRVTYEGFAAAWPDRDDEMGFAEKHIHPQRREPLRRIMRAEIRAELAHALHDRRKIHL